mmetsp:Transcript_4741/g.11521  ORF Transcript_4741/g.11521 Transcript_4741/m.11521 type:complete len:224 (+) Transcript_4741:254-925(+)
MPYDPLLLSGIPYDPLLLSGMPYDPLLPPLLGKDDLGFGDTGARVTGEEVAGAPVAGGLTGARVTGALVSGAETGASVPGVRGDKDGDSETSAAITVGVGVSGGAIMGATEGASVTGAGAKGQTSIGGAPRSLNTVHPNCVPSNKIGKIPQSLSYKMTQRCCKSSSRLFRPFMVIKKPRGTAVGSGPRPLAIIEVYRKVSPLRKSPTIGVWTRGSKFWSSSRT